MAATFERRAAIYKPLDESGRPRPSLLSPDQHERLTTASTTLAGLLNDRDSWPMEGDPTCEQFADLPVTARFRDLPASVRGLLTTVSGGLLDNAEIDLVHQATVRHELKNGELQPLYNGSFHTFEMATPNSELRIVLEPDMDVLARQREVFQPGRPDGITHRPLIKRLDAALRDGTVVRSSDRTLYWDKHRRELQHGIINMRNHPNEKQLELFTELSGFIAGHRGEVPVEEPAG